MQDFNQCGQLFMRFYARLGVKYGLKDEVSPSFEDIYGNGNIEKLPAKINRFKKFLINRDKLNRKGLSELTLDKLISDFSELTDELGLTILREAYTLKNRSGLIDLGSGYKILVVYSDGTSNSTISFDLLGGSKEISHVPSKRGNPKRTIPGFLGRRSLS